MTKRKLAMVISVASRDTTMCVHKALNILGVSNVVYDLSPLLWVPRLRRLDEQAIYFGFSIIIVVRDGYTPSNFLRDETALPVTAIAGPIPYQKYLVHCLRQSLIELEVLGDD